MDNLHYRLTFDLDNKNKIRAEIVTIFEPKVVTIFRTQHNNEKICKFCTAIFSTHYNIFQPNFGILLLLKGSFREFRFSRLDLSK